MNNIQIRDYQPGDFQQLCAIFIRAVTMTASQHYSPQQIAAWAQIDESRWKEKLAKSQVRVAVINAKLVGFITCVNTISICYLLTLNTPAVGLPALC